MATQRQSQNRERYEDLPPLIAVERAARFLGLSRASAYRYAAAGELPTRRLGGRVYVVTQGLRPIIEVTEQEAA